MINGVLCDLSGVLYVGDQPVAEAREAVISLAAAGLPIRFMTNTTRKSKREILSKLAGMGLDVADEDLFTPAVAARTHVKEQGLVPHLLIHPNLESELGDLAGSNPDAVLLGDAGPAFSYANLNHAFRILIGGAPLLAMGMNRYFRENGGLSLDMGPFVRALEYAADVQAIVLGKPAPTFYRAAVESLGLEPHEVAMVGDDYEADVDGALAAGLQAILVRTGKYRPGDEGRIRHHGATVCDNIGAAADLIL